MELYLLDSLLRRTEVVDLYDSLIWTERFSALGEIELVISSTPTTRQLLVADQILGMNKSDYIMVIDSVEEKDDSEGRSLLTIKGPSLEYILDDRLALPPDSMLALDPDDPGNTEKKWIINKTPNLIATEIFQKIVAEGVYDVNDKLPFLTARPSGFDLGNNPVKTVDVTPVTNPNTGVVTTPNGAMAIDITASVLSNIANLAQSYSFGFRLVRDKETSKLYFDIYLGDDRTSKQSIYPAVIFSQELGNLNSTSLVSTTSGRKNVAYVIAPKGKRTVYGDGVDSTVTGFDRHVLRVDASDITLPAGDNLQAALEKRGQAALQESSGSVQGMDGEITNYTGYTYGKDYKLGDIVEIRNPDGVTTEMQVTEQIFVMDDQGERSYPTMTATLFIKPGSWYSGIGAHVWDDAVGTWNDQPH